MDALPAAASGPRARLMTNIGLAFVQLGQYADAAGAFETAINLAPDHQVQQNCSSICIIRHAMLLIRCAPWNCLEELCFVIIVLLCVS